MLRVIVETVEMWIVNPFDRHRVLDTGIVVFLAITLKTWTGNIQRSACWIYSQSTLPLEAVSSFGLFCGGVDDMRHVDTCVLYYQRFGWFHNTKEYSCL